MVTISEALNIIYTKVNPVKTEIIALELLSDRVIAEDIYAKISLPSYDNSAMDGYAAQAYQVSQSFKVDTIIFAGDGEEHRLENNQIVKIMTGAKVPNGADVIVPIENVIVNENNTITLPDNLKKGNHIRLKGEDICENMLLVKEGQLLNAYHIAQLASQGISSVKVYKKPRVVVFASGQELKMHYETLGNNQLFNSNTPMLLARTKELGCEVIFMGSIEDNLEAIKQTINDSLDADLIFTTGGASVGDADYTKEAFSAFITQEYFQKINIKPGKPTSMSRINNTIVLNLPGNPLAAAINYEIFAKVIIQKLRGVEKYKLATFQAPIKNDISIKGKKHSVILGYWNGAFFTPTVKSSPGMISPMTLSNCMAILDKGIENIAQNTQLDLVQFGQSLIEEHS